jgi:WhiB family redox-sensing transcriptional regulator
VPALRGSTYAATPMSATARWLDLATVVADPPERPIEAIEGMRHVPLAKALGPRPSWHAKAACRGIGPAPFFGGQPEEVSAEIAALCAGCPVRAACLDWANRHAPRDGIWAGSPRRTVERAGSVAAPPTPSADSTAADCC